jgi:hypothetical protein
MTRYLLLSLFIPLLIAGIVQAQQEFCPVDFETIFDQIVEDCTSLGRNQVCYGNWRIDAETTPNSDNFIQSGDIIPVNQLISLRTYPLSSELDDWGIALFRVQANIADTLPGQNVTIVAFGDTEIQPDLDAEGESLGTMRAFYLTTGIGIPTCKDIPEGGILLQTPRGGDVSLVINGFDLMVGSTVLLTAADTDELTVATIEGNVEVTVNGVVQSIPVGQKLHIIREDNGLESSTATAPEALESVEIAQIPISLLPDHIPIPATDGWVSTGVQVVAGQRITISVTGIAASCNHDDCPEPYDQWVSPSGLIETECSDCLMTGVPEMAVVGRIDETSPFLVGYGGEFVVDTSGTLFLAANDAAYAYDDNAGTFYALVTVADQ